MIVKHLWVKVSFVCWTSQKYDISQYCPIKESDRSCVRFWTSTRTNLSNTVLIRLVLNYCVIIMHRYHVGSNFCNWQKSNTLIAICSVWLHQNKYVWDAISSNISIYNQYLNLKNRLMFSDVITFIPSWCFCLVIFEISPKLTDSVYKQYAHIGLVAMMDTGSKLWYKPKFDSVCTAPWFVEGFNLIILLMVHDAILT